MKQIKKYICDCTHKSIFENIKRCNRCKCILCIKCMYKKKKKEMF